MSTNISPPKTPIMPPPGYLFSLQQVTDDNLDHRIMFLNLPLAKEFDLGNTQIDFICRRGTVTLLHSSHFQELLSFTTILHSTRHTVPYKAPVPGKDSQDIVHIGTGMTSTMAVMAVFEYSPLSGSPDNSCHIHPYRECPQALQEKFQSIYQHLPALLFDQDLLPVYLDLLMVHLGGPTYVSQRKGCTRQQNKPQLILHKCRCTSTAGYFLWWIGSWENQQLFVKPGRCRRRSLKQCGANRILLAPIRQQDGAAQL